MKKHIICLLQFVLFMIAAQSSFAQSGKFGQLIYTPTAGWKPTKYQTGVTIGNNRSKKQTGNFGFGANLLSLLFRKII